MRTVGGVLTYIDITSLLMRSYLVHVTAESRKELDWENQDACIIGWGSPFDADVHTRKVFGTDANDNYTGYSNSAVDAALKKAYSTSDSSLRKSYYKEFLQAMTTKMPYTFIAYVDVDYAVRRNISGISKDTLLGHHGVGIFWNIAKWKLDEQ